MELLLQTLSLAMRNLLKNRRRTLLTLVSIFAGIIGLVFLDGYVNYSMWGFKETIIRTGRGHVQVAASPDYFTEGDLDPFAYLLTNSDALIRKIRRLPEVQTVLPVITFSAVISANGKTENALASAMPPDDAQKALSFRTIAAGRNLADGDKRGIVIGKGLAKKLGVTTNDTVFFTTVTKGGSVNAQDFEVVGISQSGIAVVDGMSATLGLDTAKELLQVDSVPLLQVYLDKTEDSDAVYADLVKKILPKAGTGLVAKEWTELSPEYAQGNAAYQMVLTVARFIVLLVAAFAIGNTVSMAVFERTREIGTLRAVGATKGEIFRLFVAEGLLLGTVGAVAAELAGLGLCALVNAAGGIPFPPQPNMSEWITIFFRPDPVNQLQNVIVAVCVAVFGSIFPAARAMRCRIAETLRYV
jgi:putative ABC transport system permease protein